MSLDAGSVPVSGSGWGPDEDVLDEDLLSVWVAVLGAVGNARDKVVD